MLLKSWVTYGGSAGARTLDHLIKSQITTVIYNNLQLIKDVISVICAINNKPQYCTYLWSSATNLQHYRPPTTPTGYPLFRYSERETILPKNPCNNVLQELGILLGGGVWLFFVSYFHMSVVQIIDSGHLIILVNWIVLIHEI